jgi:hypothetical protein
MKVQQKIFFTFMVVLLVSSLLAGCNSKPGLKPAAVITPTQAVATADGNVPVGTPSAISPVDVTAMPPNLPFNTAIPELSKLVAPVWGVELSSISQAGGLDLVKQAGVYWVRRNALLWSEVEPTEGVRNWEAVAGLETELQAAAAQGLHVILVVRSTPEWAQSSSGSKCSAPKPEKLTAYADFMRDAVQRFSQPPYNIQYWEIGNEPDVAPEVIAGDAPFGCWGNSSDVYYGGGYYAEILRAIYPQIKSANPQAQVLIGGLLLDCDPRNPPETGSGPKDCTPSRYLEGILAGGGGDFFDGISYHAYDYFGQQLGTYGNSNWASAWNVNGPVLSAKAGYLRSLLDQYNVKGKYLLNTELALLCGRDGSEPVCQSQDFLLTKSYYLAEAYTSAIAEQLTANIWYNLPGWRGSGLIDNNIEPNKAYQALKTSSEQLGGTAYQGLLTDYPSVKAIFLNARGRLSGYYGRWMGTNT